MLCGEWLSPADRPVTPQVSTPPRPLVLKEDPKEFSMRSFRTTEISSRHRLVQAASTGMHQQQGTCRQRVYGLGFRDASTSTALKYWFPIECTVLKY
jgi:hypothetical protein